MSSHHNKQNHSRLRCIYTLENFDEAKLRRDDPEDYDPIKFEFHFPSGEPPFHFHSGALHISLNTDKVYLLSAIY